MKKYVVISVNGNEKYSYYLPLIVFAWRSFGWDVLIFYNGESDKKLSLIYGTFDYINESMHPKLQDYYRLIILGLDPVEGFKSSTIAQVSRLYACCALNPDWYIMTTDCDMLPLSDYWKVESKPLYTDRNGSGKHYMKPKPSAWGRDLTDYHFPICYIGATSADWVDIMKIDNLDYNKMIKRDVTQIKPRIDEWQLDQDIATQRINEYGTSRFNLINRGVDVRTGYPLGRVDRSNWHMNHTQLIDAHLPHDILTNDDSFKKVVDLLHHVWPKTNWNWFINYHKEFKKLL